MVCKSKPQWDITSYLSEWLLSKRQQIAILGKDMEKREPLYTFGGNVNWWSHCGKQYGGFSRTKNRATIWPSNSTPGYITNKTPKIWVWKDTFIPTFTVALFTIAKIWKQPKRPSTDEWIKKMWYTYIYIYIYENNFAICSNMDRLGRHYVTWNKCQTEKDKYCMMSLICGI